jgi:MjaI restriction endonuclease
MVNKWAKDLILTKTFVGLCFQESILIKVATLKGMSYRLSTPEEESTGIDGYVGKNLFP